MSARPHHQFARRVIEAVAPNHTLHELGKMQWPAYKGGTARLHPKTIERWLLESGIRSKPVIREHEMSQESRDEINRLHAEGHAMKALARREWKTKGGMVKKFQVTSIKYACGKRRDSPQWAKQHRTAEASFDEMMLGFSLE